MAERVICGYRWTINNGELHHCGLDKGHGGLEHRCGQCPETLAADCSASVPPEPPTLTVAGWTIRADPRTPPGEAWIVDPRTGEILGKITGLARSASGEDRHGE